jgi:hypothetical protein
MADGSVQRLVAEASVEDVNGALERAVRDGSADAGFGERVEAGAVLAIRLRVSVEAIDPGGDPFVVERVNTPVWVEGARNAPEIEEQVRTISGKDFPDLANELRRRSVEITPRDLEEMYVTVVLTDELRSTATTVRRSSATA